MKFANLTLDSDKRMENIGDWLQIFAIQNLYHYMNVRQDDIVQIKISELNTYNGEYVILPVNFPMYGYYELSSKIIPVYLGVSIISGSAVGGLQMKNYQPIGCRDYHTLQELQKQNIDAYYGGCLSIAFPLRKNVSAKKTFIVDVSENILNKIPSHIKEHAEYVTHIYYNNECGGAEKAQKVYKRYEQEAGLMITSRIHCAQPCLALGIPVIFICEIKSFRYEVLRQFLPIYTLDEMDKINWNPQPVDIEEHKKNLLDYASDRIWETYHKYQKRCVISDFYLKNPQLDYKIDSVWAFQIYVRNNWSKTDFFQYAIWGITQSAEVIYSWINENYPNAELAKVIDNKNFKKFHGIIPETEDKLEQCSIPVFVTAGSVNPIAERVFKKYGVKKYVICYNNLYIVDGVHKTY